MIVLLQFNDHRRQIILDIPASQGIRENSFR